MTNYFKPFYGILIAFTFVLFGFSSKDVQPDSIAVAKKSLAQKAMEGKTTRYIRGRVLDYDPLPIGIGPMVGASVQQNLTVGGTTVDIDGYFQLANIPTGAPSLTIKFIGYYTVEVSLSSFSGTGDIDIGTVYMKFNPDAE